ncbi:hypothetical protein TREPR_3114 [Treponema primitia ZAS-2]|uniref:Uncharacterized protein n=1 Tax=Treponema primitia (strain ATCC BAA-887 / DSM 12427 / ZAS-2) TaxID=545694 RepID=D8L141_TREPZ|nr:hypothetical protein [Treponema primitia]ADJ19585.1 hypothetical protein [Treponema primitia ZAS-2]AEF86978.1 hypothetical protein TREPR_3114 [Treponema primitia ZAS-2]
MNRDLQTKAERSNKIKQSIFNFLDMETRKIVLSILPNNEWRFLPPNFSDSNSIEIFEDYFFVIEKFLNTHIIPQKYYIFHSSKLKNQLMENSDIETQLKKRIKYFQCETKKINDRSYNFLPNSAYTYYTDESKDKNHRKYINDFLFNSFRIRHFHLVKNKDNDLIFYVIFKDNLYLINKGNHNSIYEEETPKILIEEFPELLEPLGIHKLSSANDPGYPCWGKELECQLKNGRSVIPLINDCLYMPALMSRDGMDSQPFSILITILKKLDIQIDKMLTLLKNSQQDIFIAEENSKMSLKLGGIYIADRNSNFEYCIGLPYFKNLQLVDRINSYKINSKEATA